MTRQTMPPVPTVQQQLWGEIKQQYARHPIRSQVSRLSIRVRSVHQLHVEDGELES